MPPGDAQPLDVLGRLAARQVVEQEPRCWGGAEHASADSALRVGTCPLDHFVVASPAIKVPARGDSGARDDAEAEGAREMLVHTGVLAFLSVGHPYMHARGKTQIRTTNAFTAAASFASLPHALATASASPWTCCLWQCELLHPPSECLPPFPEGAAPPPPDSL